MQVYPLNSGKSFGAKLAEITIKLAAIRMPKIGSIIRDPVDQRSFVVGPLNETGSGPYASAADFYADYPLALSKRLANGAEPVDGQSELVGAFRSLAASFPPPAARNVNEGTAGDFGLANFDLNPNNVIVDRQFNVLSVIDWDTVVAVPDAALYRIPPLMGLGFAVPGVVAERPAERERQRCGREYTGVVEDVGREMSRNGGEGVNKRRNFLLTESAFFSKEAVAFRLLIMIRQQQDFVNRRCVEGLKWLSEHDEAAVAQFYLGH